MNFVRLETAMKKKSIVILSFVLIITSCKLNLDSPFDPKSSSYIGYDTVKNLDDIEAIANNSSGYFWYPVLTINPCSTAISYEYQISNSASGFDNPYYTTIDQPMNTLDLYETNIELNIGVWYWRGRGIDISGNYGSWSKPVSFSLISLNNMIPTDGEDSTDTTPLFSWEEVLGANHYEIQISESDMDIFTSNKIVTYENSYTPLIGLTNYSTCYWRVRAINDDGNETAWSDLQSFLISWGSIQGISPANGEGTNYVFPTLSWDPVDGAVNYEIQNSNNELDITSSIINQTSTNSYVIPTPMSLGEIQYWRVRAVDEGGQKTVWSTINTFFESLVSDLYIHGNSYTMGYTGSLNWSMYDDQKPSHFVTLSGFYIAQTELTFAHWKEVYDWAQANGYTFANSGSAGDTGDASDEPVINISWRDAIVWCNAASAYLSLTPLYTYGGSIIKNSTDSTSCDNAVCDWSADGFRLPTESEFEYIAQGANLGTYWYEGNSDYNLYPVGILEASDQGLFDIKGNAAEWCWDWYGSYTSISQIDPHGASSGSKRVVRGGSSLSSIYGIASTFRSNAVPDDNSSYLIGFRTARSF